MLIVLFGFLFVTVSSRLTGEIGSSSNPISGMTVATLLLTCLCFVALGWTSPGDRLTALSVAAVVCIAASNGGTTSQDLKTGYLVGATPKWQQLAIVAGALTSALVIGWILIQLNTAYTIYTSRSLPVLTTPLDLEEIKRTGEQDKAPGDDAPYWVWRAAEGNDQKVAPGKYLVDDKGQIRYLVDPGINGKRSHRDDGSEVVRFKAPKAVLMSLITDGILRGKLPWPLVLLGVAIAIVLELCGVPSLAFAVGVYLPLSSSTPILIGGLARFVADRWGRQTPGADAETESDTSPGALLSTGYIAGGAIGGVAIAFLSFSDTIPSLMSKWQYRTHTAGSEQTLTALAQEMARHELGLPSDAFLEEDNKRRVDELADDIAGLNQELKPRFVPVPKNFPLRLPQIKDPYVVPADTTLGKLAEEKLGSAAKAQLLLSLNQNRLIRVPRGMPLALPAQKTYLVKTEGSLAEVARAALHSNDPSQMVRLYKFNRLDEDVSPRYVVVPAGKQIDLPKGLRYKAKANTYLGDVAEEVFDAPSRAADILDLNLGELVRIKPNTTLLLPEDKPYIVTQDATLEDVAQAALGAGDRAAILYDLNHDELEKPILIPKDTVLKLPQANWPGVAAFGLLTAFLIVVGLGWMLGDPSLDKSND